MKALGVVFSNIYDSSLGELTNSRTVASLPFGGRYRQIDFTLSNFSNSGIYQVGIITKYNYRSLMRHLGSCSAWDMNRKNEGVTLLPPFAGGDTGIYKGKLEALYTAVPFFDNPAYDYVVLSDSVVLCNIDYRRALGMHLRSGADITLICNRETDGEKHSLIAAADESGTVTDLRCDDTAAPGEFVGMGMFIMSRERLVQEVRNAHTRGYTHFERDFLRRAFNEGDVRAAVYEYRGTVLRNESIEDYYANNLRLLSEPVRQGLFREESPIYTKVRDEIPSYYAPGACVEDSLVADGCTLRGTVCHSVLFREVQVEEGAEVRDCVVMQNAHIERGAKLSCVILDKNVTVTAGTELRGTPRHPVIIQKGETV